MIALTLTDGVRAAASSPACAGAIESSAFAIWSAFLVFIQAGGLTRARNLDYRQRRGALGATPCSKRPGNARARINYGIELDEGACATRTPRRRCARRCRSRWIRRRAPRPTCSSARRSRRSGASTKGLPSIERALAIDPSIKEADLILGQAYADQGKDGPAVRHFLRALERQPPARARSGQAEDAHSHARRMAARDLARPGRPRRRARRRAGRARRPGLIGAGTGRLRDRGGRLRRARPSAPTPSPPWTAPSP